MASAGDALGVRKFNENAMHQEAHTTSYFRRSKDEILKFNHFLKPLRTEV